jgi:hypothetical protein
MKSMNMRVNPREYCWNPIAWAEPPRTFARETEVSSTESGGVGDQIWSAYV